MNTEKKSKKQVRRYPVSEKSLRRKKRKELLGEVSTYERVFEFRGKSLEDLRAMPLKDEISLMNANVRRTFRREWDTERQKFFDKISVLHENNKPIRTHFRDLPITSKMVGMTISVYNGKIFQKVVIIEDMIGHVLGEFVMTRKFPIHVRKGVGASKGTSHVAIK